MQGIAKQQTGFRFGKHPTKLLRLCGQLEVDGRTYRLVLLEMAEGLRYYGLRLYNGKGKFIKQLLFEPYCLNGLIDMLVEEANR